VKDRSESAAGYVAQALEAESAKQWIRSHTFCEKALRESPEDPDALNLLGRLCGLAGDADLEAARAAVPPDSLARERYAEALAIEPDIACHSHHYLARWPTAGMERIEALLRESIARDPGGADAHAALGNACARRLDRFAAIDRYALAVMLRWQFPEAHLALADLLDTVGEEAPARRHREAALSQRRVFPACACSDNAPLRVLVLATLGGAVENAPLDLVVNPSRIALHRVYLLPGEELPRDLPPCDAVFNSLEELDSSARAIELAGQLVEIMALPTINHPAHSFKTRRSELAASLAGIPGCIVPGSTRVDRERLEALPATADRVAGTPFPLLIRPVDTHRGDRLRRVDDRADLAVYLREQRSERYYVAPFVDYRSPDGYFRKYRAVVVDGRPYPYHLAVSDRWMVHYAGSLMNRHAAMRAEEERFLADPASVFPRWNETFSRIALAFGLDYFGVDFARMADGSILVFECGAGMMVHCREEDPMFAYKYRYIPRIFDAFEAMIARRIAGG
jgi:tetratricopeptide (TPR) repeat protein